MVLIGQSLPVVEKAYGAHDRQLRDERKTGADKPSAEQAKVESMFPSIAKYVRGYGFVEIGD